jgi:GT2 family glycosyltransferase
MPVHNTLPHLDQAIESILGQTFSNFEFIILDDASTDGSSERLRLWASRDRRIRLLDVKDNLGPVGSSNMVAYAAKAPLVARMDADDISAQDRLAEEFQFLQRHAEIGLVASLCEIMDASGRKLRDAEVWRLSKPSAFVPFPHGSIMYRREVFEQVGGYRKECEYWEDQDLVVRIAAIAGVAVIPRSLYCVRQSRTSTRVVSSQEQLERAVDRVYRATDRLESGRPYDDILDRPRDAGAKLDPRVFIAVGSVRLWAGDRPRLLLRMLSRARLSLDARSATALIWTAWASWSPSSLRSFMMLLLRARNRRARGRISTLTPVRWRLLESVEAIEETEGPQ